MTKPSDGPGERCTCDSSWSTGEFMACDVHPKSLFDTGYNFIKPPPERPADSAREWTSEKCACGRNFIVEQYPNGHCDFGNLTKAYESAVRSCALEAERADRIADNCARAIKERDENARVILEYGKRNEALSKERDDALERVQITNDTNTLKQMTIHELRRQRDALTLEVERLKVIEKLRKADCAYINQLTEENERLRGALEKIVRVSETHESGHEWNNEVYSSDHFGGRPMLEIARAALKGDNDESSK